MHELRKPFPQNKVENLIDVQISDSPILKWDIGIEKKSESVTLFLAIF
jgi:hypothetical protein